MPQSSPRNSDNINMGREVEQGSISQFHKHYVGLWPINAEPSFLQSPLSQQKVGDLDGEHSCPSKSSMIPGNNRNMVDNINSRFNVDAQASPSTLEGNHTYQPTLRGDLLATRPTFSQIFVMTHISPSTNQEAHRPSMVSQSLSRNFSISPCSPIIYARRGVSDDFPRVMRRTVRGRKYPIQIPVISDKSAGKYATLQLVHI